MKNMKISLKLIISFLIVIALAIFVAGVGIFGMNSINNADNDLYKMNLLPIEYLGQIRVQYNIQRTLTRNIIIYPSENPNYQKALDDLSNSEKEMDRLVGLYEPTITEQTDRDQFEIFKNVYYNDYAQVKKSLIEYGGENNFDGAVVVMDTGGAAAQSNIAAALEECMSINVTLGKKAVDGNAALFRNMTFVEIGVLLIAVIIALILAFYVSGIISKPMNRMKELMEQVGKTGDLDISPAVRSALIKDSGNKDEVGQSIVSFLSLIEHITHTANSLGIIANKDLSGEIKALSDKDVLGVSLIKMQDNLNDMFSEISSSTNQVSTGSNQIADGAQLLAQGATEQSATVEELSASVSEVSAQTKQNAGMANDAKELGESIKVSAEKGSRQMEQMMQAVKEINEASQSIGKVIKIIDDIAFQTNILALNAAVEAARAGQHGKGFAVVADEVRSLAAKSAEAAKNTNELIESSIKKAEQGASISGETAESLNQIVEGILRSSELVASISRSSNEQSIAISQISEAIDQVSQVVQQNSATAEESAAASEEMSGQATLLQQLVSQFKLRSGRSYAAGSISSAPPFFPAAIESDSTGFSVSAGSKY